MAAIVPPEDEKLILSAIERHFPGCRVRVFGSRARGDHRPHSDLDLCLDQGHPLELTKLGKLEEELTQSDLLYRVDISDWHRITPDFRAVVSREGRSMPLTPD